MDLLLFFLGIVAILYVAARIGAHFGLMQEDAKILKEYRDKIKSKK